MHFLPSMDFKFKITMWLLSQVLIFLLNKMEPCKKDKLIKLFCDHQLIDF